MADTGRLITAGRWRKVLRLMDETFEDYLTGLAALRKRVVDDMRRKVNDATVLDQPPRRARSRSAPARKRG